MVVVEVAERLHDGWHWFEPLVGPMEWYHPEADGCINEAMPPAHAAFLRSIQEKGAEGG